MIFSKLEKSATLAFNLQICFYPFCDKGFGKDCRHSLDQAPRSFLVLLEVLDKA